MAFMGEIQSKTTPPRTNINTKFNFGKFGSHYIWYKTNTAFIKNNFISKVKHGGYVMVYGCFAALGLTRLALIT